MKYLNSHIAISHKDFLEETKRDKSVFYFLPEFHQYNGLPKWHGELHDGVIKDEKSIYLFIAEHDYFIKNSEFISDFYKKDNYIKKIYYQAEFANKEELGCEGSISVLGRAFFPRSSFITWGEQPRGTLIYNIFQHKEQKEKNEFTKWDKVLVEAMKEYLIAFINTNAEDDNNFESDILRSEYGTKIILTSIPNSDGNSRFNNFLNKFDNIGDHIFIYKDFFTHTRTPEGTRGDTYSKKMNILKDLYTVNEKYVKEVNQKTKIIIIDDVLTTGAHLELCINSIKNSKCIDGYEIHGVFLAATQSNPEYFNSTGINYRRPRFRILNIDSV